MTSKLTIVLIFLSVCFMLMFVTLCLGLFAGEFTRCFVCVFAQFMAATLLAYRLLSTDLSESVRYWIPV